MGREDGGRATGRRLHAPHYNPIPRARDQFSEIIFWRHPLACGCAGRPCVPTSPVAGCHIFLPSPAHLFVQCSAGTAAPSPYGKSSGKYSCFRVSSQRELSALGRGSNRALAGRREWLILLRHDPKKQASGWPIAFGVTKSELKEPFILQLFGAVCGDPAGCRAERLSGFRNRPVFWPRFRRIPAQRATRLMRSC